VKEYKLIAPLYDVLLYPFVRNIRRDILKTAIRLQPEKVIDVCCGTGDQLKRLKRYGIDAVGIDLSQAMIDISQKGNHTPRCFLQDATAMTFNANSFDLAMISFALHETGWENAHTILSEIYRVLKQDGKTHIPFCQKSTGFSNPRDICSWRITHPQAVQAFWRENSFLLSNLWPESVITRIFSNTGVAAASVP
jgi:ubiquinone/menaquinone biosynthesis C-methylase UbiE